MLQLLKPYNINQEKVRIGPKTPGRDNHGDGGYITPVNIIEKSVALFTYGVAGDIRYETEYAAKYGKTAYLYDHTVNHPTNPAPGLVFKAEGLGINIPKCKDFINHYSENNIVGDVLLKVDIEGAEYDYFNNVNMKELAHITTGIVLEIHELYRPEIRDLFISMMNKFKPYFVVNHVHANNWGGKFDYVEKVHESKFTGYIVPNVIEITFANKRYVDVMIPDSSKFPVPGLDLPNNANIDDLNLDFLNDF